MTLVAIFGLVFLMGGLIFQAFSVWQMDLLFVTRMWGPCQTNIQFYTDLLGNGYSSWSKMPFSINIWLFPNMVAGLAYDLLMIVNLAMSMLIAAGAVMIGSSLRIYQTAIRKANVNLRKMIKK